MTKISSFQKMRSGNPGPEKTRSQNVSGPFAQYRKNELKKQNTGRKSGSRAVLSLWSGKIVYEK
jgi:hypothetical protein